MRITVLSGGVGGARFLRGLRDWSAGEHQLTAVVNTGDDMWLTGLRVCPDLDSITYTLAGVSDEQRGWGRVGETERVSAELAAFGVGWPWFTLGDLDLGTHIARSHHLRSGLSLSEATRLITSRWELGVELLPVTDDEVETHVVTADGELHFEEWWTRLRASVPATAFVQRGVSASTPALGVLEAIGEADLVILAPSNPVVSVGTVLGIPGVRAAVGATSASVVGVSPIIGGAVVRGMADVCLTAIGVETSAEAVAAHYGSRSTGGLLDGWLVDETDAAALPAIGALGINSRAVPLWMRDAATSSQLAADTVTLGLQARA